MKKRAIQLFFGLFLVISANVVFAQPPDGGSGGPSTPPAPIDGGISAVLAAGVMYGVKKIYDKKKK